MARIPAWQSRFDGFDFSDFAQEFLRRNPAYRDQFVRASRLGSGTTHSVAARRSARAWGLEFPGRSSALGGHMSGHLAKPRQSGRGGGGAFVGSN